MNTLLIVDADTREEIGRCSGPAADGTCRLVAIGDIVACAGLALVPAAASAGAQPYAVPGLTTRCPVTVAAALAASPDTLLTTDA